MTPTLIILFGFDAKVAVGAALVLGLCAYGINAWLARPRPATARSFD